MKKLNLCCGAHVRKRWISLYFHRGGANTIFDLNKAVGGEADAFKDNFINSRNKHT